MVKKVLDDAPAQEAGAAEDRHLSDICHLTHDRATGPPVCAAAQALSGRLQAKLALPAPEEQARSRLRDHASEADAQAEARPEVHILLRASPHNCAALPWRWPFSSGRPPRATITPR